MRIDILTLFPESFSYLNSSILKRAQENGLLEINLIDILREIDSCFHLRIRSKGRGSVSGFQLDGIKIKCCPVQRGREMQTVVCIGPMVSRVDDFCGKALPLAGDLEIPE